MACKKCGRPCIGDLCEKCRPNEPLFGEAKLVKPFVDEEDEGPAVAAIPAVLATVLGAICALFSILSFVFSLINFRAAQLGDTSFRSAIVVGLVFACLGAFGGAPTIALAITSLKYYVLRRNAGRKKPFATLVLCIIGMSLALAALLFAVLGLLFTALSIAA